MVETINPYEPLEQQHTFMLTSHIYTTPYLRDGVSFDLETAFNNNEIKARFDGTVVPFSSLTVSKQTFSVADALTKGRWKVDVSYTSGGETYYTDLEVVVRMAKPTTLSMDLSNLIYSYANGGSKVFNFKLPTIVDDEVYFNYNDTTLTPDDYNGALNVQRRAGIKYYTKNESTGVYTELRENDQIDLSNGPLTIYARYGETYYISNLYVTNDTTHYILEKAFQLTAEPKRLVKAYTHQPNNGNPVNIDIKKGKRLSDYQSDFGYLYFVYNDDTTTSLNSYRFTNDEPILSSSDIQTISVEVAGETVNLILGQGDVITVSDNTISSIEAKTPIPSSYELNEGFNFSNLVFIVHYEDTDYTTEATFWAGSNGFTISYDTQSLSQEEDFDGTNTFADQNITEDETGELTFTVSSSIASNTKSISIPILITEILENIVGIEIIDPYRDYKVGERFLKLEDTTEVKVNYRDSQNQLKSIQFRLNAGHKKITTDPIQGTLLDSVQKNLTVRVSATNNGTIFQNYSITVNSADTINNTDIKHFKISNAGGSYVVHSITTPDGDVITSSKGLLRVVDSDGNAKGYICDILDKNIKGGSKLVLYEDYKPELRSAANIDVIFPSYVEGSADEINKCHFGVLFGANNAKNRLFLSGNPDEANADWHSAEVNYVDEEDTENCYINGNFTYFTDESLMYYGETDNKIIGYEVISNDKLLVLKDKSDKEKTVYFRNPTVVKAIDAAGSSVEDVSGEGLYQEEFSLTKGNNSVAGVSPKTICNFNGDTLFLDSNKQLVGLDVAGIIGDNQRYANSRSLYIDKMLNSLDLKNAVLWTNNTYLFLSIKNYGLFVTHFKTFNSETKQYEWFYLTSENPVSFLELNDVIYFANEDGSLFKFTDKTYEDIKKVYASDTLDYGQDGTLTVSSAVITELKKRDGELRFRTIVPNDADYTKKVYYKVATMSNDVDDEADILICGDSEESYFEVINENVLPHLTENSIFFLKYFDPKHTQSDISINGTGRWANSYGEKFRIRFLEPDGLVHGDRFIIQKLVSGEWVDEDAYKLTAATLCGCLEDKEAIVTDIDATNSTFRLKLDFGNGEKPYVNICRYGEQDESHNFKSEIREYNNVEAFYITAPFALGSLDYFKTIYSYTLTNDVGIPSQLDVAYASNKLPIVDMKKMSTISLTKEQLGLDFSDMSFKKVDFDKTVVPRTYTVSRILSHQKFICFAFKNYDNTNAVLSAMSITYTTPFPSYGGD